ncbi:TetR/AcrR family transcriptional regulator [Streptomyces platensis]|uniref:Bacterial regulatory protein n=1 Tax=Streptomyces platensis TaxID=58346 RepID=A0AAE6NH16_STRPT|nr:TetR/AcrR family transcriptional regulator [Streptomyces platensis]OSY46167.1 Bacterial regulatory protein [Streptomyces platensis]QEV51695.1 TetR/AcrR family transcriptional regulator [Streptomyces platensis]BCK72227.1 TetR family transcriptional regulator [Streptomyces libani subsp. rufus]
MAVLAEQDSEKAARILTVARDLVLKRGVKGVTVAEIADKAHVGKGTVYLYWATKEDLLVGLFARDFLHAVDGNLDALTTDPDLSRPHRLCPRLIHTALDHPFVRGLMTGDADLLGVLTQHPRSMKLLNSLGPAALMYSVLPVWRQHRLARTDWPLDEQAYALQALMDGFTEAAIRTHALPGTVVDEPDKVIAAAVTALLGPEQASPDDIHATADEGLRELRRRRELLLASITTHEE